MWRPTGPKTRPFRFGLQRGVPDDPELRPGAIVGDRYRVLGTLGAGGMGRVYDVEPLVAGGTATRVALKILRRERGQGEHLARFRQEAKAAARVGHPSIVQVLDFAELPDGTVYLAMERLRGQSFEDWISGPGRLRDGLVFLAEVARGLAAAHAVGIVHRDVKPANLFMHVDPDRPDARPRAKILDFGIAKVVTRDATQIETQAGTLLGTPYYLAPERALGHRLEPRADLYSLGVILYEVLTGVVPFEDDNFMGILAQHIRTPPLDPRQAAPDRPLPSGVCMLAIELLAKDPAHRPPDGVAVAERIEDLLRTEAAAIDAVGTGPRQPTTAADPTVQIDDLAQRPTSAPAQPPRSVASVASVATRAMGSGASSAGAMVLESFEGSGPMSFAEPVAIPTEARPATHARWPVAVALLAVLAVVGGGLAWGLSAGDRAPDPAPGGDGVASPSREPAAGVAGAGAAGAAPPPAPAPAGARGAAGAEPPRAGSTAEPAEAVEPATAVAPTPAATTDATTERTRSRTPRATRSKAKPRPSAPPPPDFKDDVYED